METNVLYYGDNLDILRKYIPDNSVDLIYLDPPFNSKRTYNIIFKENDSQWSPAQIGAFEDTWRWDSKAEATYQDIITNASIRLAKLISAMREGIGANDATAYLVMVAARLAELHRVLKDTGSIFFHCDPTMSHYIKLIMDQIFGPANFRNEIVWKRSTAHSDIGQGAKHLGRLHDIIFLYSKSDNYTANMQFLEYNEDYVNSFYRHVEPDTGRRYRLGDITGPGGAAKGNPEYEFLGVTRYWRYSKERMQQLYEEGRIVQTKPGVVPAYKRYLDEMSGVPLQDIWDDILPIGAQANERLGYPTQKPLALLERIVSFASNEGDTVLDPFCGCGTAVVAAHKLNRQWIGIDITHLSIAVMKRRLQDHFPGIHFQVIGEPVDLPSAKELARLDRYQFQWWALSLIGARPVDGKKKGADKGIDGVIPFADNGGAKLKRIVVQVKSGHVSVKDVRELNTVVGNDPIGILVTLEQPTQPMHSEAVQMGFYDSPLWQKKFPRIQIMTIEEILAGKQPDIPSQLPPPKATKIQKGKQPKLI
jgi:DNA modification methylase